MQTLSPETADPSPKTDQARNLLRSLHANSPFMQANALVSQDGRMLASVMGREIDADRLAALCAALLALVKLTAKEVHRGEIQQIFLDGVNGPLLMTEAGESGLLVVVAGAAANFAQVVLRTQATAKALADLGRIEAN